MSVTKIAVLIILLIILISLGSALFQLIRRGRSGKSMAKALTVRISLSISLLILIIIAGAMGWIKPHSLVPTTPQTSVGEQ